MSSARDHRLAILSHEEVDELYALPRFADEDRHTYFDLSPPEREAVEARIFYNTALLSKIYDQKLANSDEAAIEILRGTSPVAWQHVNLFGSIEFNDLGDPVDIDALAARYADPEFWSQALRELQAEPLA